MSYQYQSIPAAPAVADDNKNVSGYGAGNGLKLEEGRVIKGEAQPTAYRDVCFGIFFWLQLATVVTLSAMYATGRIEVNYEDLSAGGSSRRFLKKTSDDDIIFPLPILVGGLSSLVVAPLLAVGVFSCLANNASSLMKLSIYAAIGINLVLTLVLLFSGAIGPAFATGLGAFFTWMYARAVWSRIPLAAANLKTAIASIQSQLGVAFLGITSLPVYIVWFAMWIYFFVSTLSTPFMQSQVESTKLVHSGGYKGDDDYVATIEESRSALWYFLFFLMLLSFYWTSQVIGNTVQATVAGAIGTFWFVPEEAVGCCSSGLTSSLFRSLTYSFGSICMGSLLVAIIQALRAMVRQAQDSARNNRDGGGALILCLAECLLGMLEAAAEYFNKWAFIYVGLYGYGYMEAGKNVLTLFRQRGWTSIITDNLTSRALGIMSFTIGLCTGLVAAFLALVTAWSSPSSTNDSDTSNAMALGSLFLGLVFGMVLASIVFGVVNSAADTIVVLFAEAPFEFQQNHPVLSAEMNQAWSAAYPDTFRPVAPTMVV